jgi:hypothetical protein
MPTWNVMLVGRRGGSALVVGMLAFGALWLAPATSGAVAATTTSAPLSTTTTLPAAFGLPTDEGFKLVQAQTQAQLTILASQPALVAAQRQTRAAQLALDGVRAERDRLDAQGHATAIRLDATRARLRAAAVAAYVHAGGGELDAAISSFASASSAVDIGRQMHMIGTYGNNQKDALDAYLALKAQVDEQIRVISDRFNAATRARHDAMTRRDGLRLHIADAKQQLSNAVLGIMNFHQQATSALSPILGPGRLSARQMADYVKSEHYTPDITVPVEMLAQIYLDEGAKLGVRGDVAWAQSILETAGFAHPGSAPDNNNFAGIGWCDTCKHGIDFPDAVTGARAQMQLLRTYVDPSFPDKTYTDPVLIPGSLQLGFRGKVQSWWDLWGTWATGALYGQRVYDIYEKMVAFSAFDPDPPPVPKQAAAHKPIPRKP